MSFSSEKEMAKKAKRRVWDFKNKEEMMKQTSKLGPDLESPGKLDLGS